MNNHFSRAAFKGKNCESSENRLQLKKKILTGLIALTLISLLISTPQMVLMVSASSEPSIIEVLNNSGFSNIEPINIETFPGGIYNITLLAEFAGYYNNNILSFYEVGTTDYQVIFTGPEGATTGDNGGYVVPPLSKIFEVDSQFGLSMNTPEHQYFTEHDLNPDFPLVHAQVYKNLDNPNMLLIGFENYYDEIIIRDYNDMVFSLTILNPLEIVSVSRIPEIPNYNEPVMVTSQINKGSYEIDSVILSYQAGSGSWTNVTMILDNTDYVANIPAQAYGTLVNYKVYALDTFGNFDVSSVYSYTVGDFVAPIISDVIQVPSTPNPGISVTVSAKVTEPSGASGVKNATVWVYSASVWSSIDMTFENGLWNATIPGQASGSTIQVYVKAFDNAGNTAQTATLSYTVNTFNQPPKAEFSAPETAYTNEVVNFDGSASYDSDGSIISYSWNFGDGTTATGVTASHAYANEGEYFVTLTVMDNRGTLDTESKSILIENRPPVEVNNPPTAIFTTSPETVYATEKVTFNAVDSYDTDGTIDSYEWSFGDGTTATGIIVSHTYANDGSYTVKLTVTDNDGATDSTTGTKSILNNPPEASFTQSSEEANKGAEITFDASESEDIDGTIVEYAWNFGDGTTATGVTSAHAYTNSGTFTITLTVVDDDGATDSVTSTVTAVNQGPVAAFTANTTTIIENQGIQVDASESSDNDGTIASYSWDFGDGTTATGVISEHVYTQEGDYTVTLTVTDNDGATASTTENVNVSAEPEITLAILSVIGLGITALTATLLYGLFVRRNKKKKSKKTN